MKSSTCVYRASREGKAFADVTINFRKSCIYCEYCYFDTANRQEYVWHSLRVSRVGAEQMKMVPVPDAEQIEMVLVPRTTRFPVEVAPSPGFVPEDPSTWPEFPGRFEYVAGRLLYMPPCGGTQGRVVISAARIVDEWVDEHSDFVAGTGEAGMLLDGDVRGADAAVWRRVDLDGAGSGFPRVPPVLVVEVAGQDEAEAKLRDKAKWYLANGVALIWLVFPSSRQVAVLRRGGEGRYRVGERLPEDPELPGLSPEVARFFRRLPDD